MASSHIANDLFTFQRLVRPPPAAAPYKSGIINSKMPLHSAPWAEDLLFVSDFAFPFHPFIMVSVLTSP